MKWNELKKMEKEQLKLLEESYEVKGVDEVARKMGVLRYDLSKDKIREIFLLNEMSDIMEYDNILDVSIQEKAALVAIAVAQDDTGGIPIFAILHTNDMSILGKKPAQFTIWLYEEHPDIFEIAYCYAVVYLVEKAAKEGKNE